MLWTDSTCVLHWLKTCKSLPVFVDNQVKEVSKATDISFLYAPSNKNPANLPTTTTGLLVAEISEATLW